MKKFFQFTKAIFILTVLISVLAITGENAFAENETFKIAPPSQKFLEWQQKQNSKTQNIYRDKSSSMKDLPRVSGYIPLAVDLSHLSKNPPIEISKRDKATTIPSAYDLRTAGNFLTSVKDQDPYGTCWAFSAIGSMESNYMKQGNPEINLSVMHLAWFAYKNTDSSKTFTDNGWESDEVFYGDRVLNNGGNQVFSVATYSRLDGPVLESDVPYGIKPSYSVPEAYNRVLRLRDAYFFDANSRTFDSMSNVKERIIKHGAVEASYCGDAYDAYAVINGYSTFYKKTNEINHAILLVGWDDNFSKDNFKYKPSSDGAWLVKNSWGDRWNNSSYQKVGDNGYFWISYEQTLSEGVSFIVEAVNSDLKCYYYDALGWIGNLYGSSYAANIFQASRTNEKLKEIGFYTPDNNQTCEIKIYTGINSLSSNPNSGTLALTQSEYIASAGYHTVTLNSPVELTNGEYFSVIVKYPTSAIPIEHKVSYYSDNAKIDSGSYFSSNGSYWQKGTSSSIEANACIKAFTVTGDSFDEPDKPDEPIITGEAPTITTTSIKSTGKTDAIYSQTFRAIGDYPIYWTYSGTIPTGLKFSNSGVLAGMPSETGTFTFTVIATNAYGSDSREFTVRISSGASSAVAPSISEATLDNGYVSESYSQTIEISGTTPFSIAKKSGFPSGLTPRISGSNLIIAGTPKKEGKFSLSVTVKNSAGSDTQDFSLTILEKPTITTKSLKNAKTDSKYSASLAAKGSNITWEVTGLPETLTLTQNSNGTKATIEGTPTEAGTYNPTFTVTNSAGTSSKTLKLIVSGVAPKLTVKFEKGTADSVYDGSTIYATGTKPITFTCSIKPTNDLKKLGISSLSDLNLTFTANSEEGTATITGTPKISFKNLPITITAKNSVSTKSKTAKLTVSGQKPVFTSPSETEYLYKTGENVNIDFEVEGTDFITFSSSGQSTLSLTKTGNKTARLSGRAPTSEKKLTIKVKASNADGNTTQKIILQTKTLPTITTEKLSNATSGRAYKTKLTASGSKKITWEISGELPDGINFDENTGSLTGTPKEDGIFDLTFTAVNSIGESTKTLTLNVGDSKDTANSLPDLVSESELNSENYSDQESTNISGISITNERNISSLSNEFIQKISDEGLVIAAVLPEFSIEEDNIYEFTVSIDENIPVNSKLIWRSQSELNTTDNSELIAFYESEDLARENAIEFVPENREIIIEVWLKLGKYSPIILAAPNDN